MTLSDETYAGLQELFPLYTIDVSEGATGVIRIVLRPKEKTNDRRIFKE